MAIRHTRIPFERELMAQCGTLWQVRSPGVPGSAASAPPGSRVARYLLPSSPPLRVTVALGVRWRPAGFGFIGVSQRHRREVLPSSPRSAPARQQV
jgi:hypothetical protein